MELIDYLHKPDKSRSAGRCVLQTQNAKLEQAVKIFKLKTLVSFNACSRNTTPLLCALNHDFECKVLIKHIISESPTGNCHLLKIDFFGTQILHSPHISKIAT